MVLDAGGATIRRATLTSLAGRIREGAVSGGEASFRGAFPTGLYLARVETTAGEITRRLNLL